jgi:hypothetical protein
MWFRVFVDTNLKIPYTMFTPMGSSRPIFFGIGSRQHGKKFPGCLK